MELDLSSRRRRSSRSRSRSRSRSSSTSSSTSTSSSSSSSSSSSGMSDASNDSHSSRPKKSKKSKKEERPSLTPEQQEERRNRQAQLGKGVKAPRQYRELINLYTEKLKEQIYAFLKVPKENQYKVSNKTTWCLYNVARESLFALRDDIMILPDDAYQRIAKECQELKVPVEFVIGAFLKQVDGQTGVYEYPHKILKEYLAAAFIWEELSAKNDTASVDIVMGAYMEAILQHDIPTVAMSRLYERFRSIPEFSPDYKFTLQRIWDRNSMSYASKYQNTLRFLLGFGFVVKEDLRDENKEELKEFLQRTGVTPTDDWIAVVNDMEFNQVVFNFLTEKLDLLNDDHIKITDSSLMAYIVLLKAKKDPMTNVKVSVSIKEETDEMDTLFRLIARHCLTLEELEVHPANCTYIWKYIHDPDEPPINPRLVIIHLDDKFDVKVIRDLLPFCSTYDNVHLDLALLFKNPHLADDDIKEAIGSTIQSCHQNINKYVGPMTDAVRNLFCKLKNISIGINKLEELGKISAMVEAMGQHSIERLELSIDAVAYTSDLIPISPMNGIPIVYLFLPDITKKTPRAVWKLARNLMPTHPKRGYCNLAFPRLQRLPLEILEKLRDVGVTDLIVFQSFYKLRVAVRRKIMPLAQSKTGCRNVTAGALDIDTW